MPLWALITLITTAAIAGSIIGSLAALGLFMLIMHNSKGSRQHR